MNALRRRAIVSIGAVGLATLVRPSAADASRERGAATEGAANPSSGASSDAGLEVAIFAGGCFWCMEPPFDKLDGVVSTTSGYTGGSVPMPTYEQVSAGDTGHYEAVRIVFDPRRVSYEKLLDVFWRNIDPTVDDRQFCDVGPQYRAAIFALDERQRQSAIASRNAVERDKPFAAPIRTPVLDGSTFHPAERYHQDYYRKNPLRYRFYRARCGRDARLAELWGAQAGGY